MEVLVALPKDTEQYKAVEKAVEFAILSATKTTGKECVVSILRKPDSAEAWCDSRVNDADFLVIDVTNRTGRTGYCLGYADALKKPRIVLESGEDQFYIRERVFYDPMRLEELKERLALEVSRILANPKGFVGSETEQSSLRTTAFVSYSHADSECLARLKIHLKPIERQGLLEVWDDTKIKSGEDWRFNIERALQRSAIAILLISPDFLASDFITDNELPPLLVSARDEGMVVLPLILRPCRFARDKNLSKFQAVNAPSEPLLKLGPVEQDELYEELAARIEAEVLSSFKEER